MAQVVSDQKYTLPSSVKLTRPDLKAFLRPDTNAGETDITQFKEQLRNKQLHIPNSTGPPSYKVTCCDNNNVVNSGQLPITSKKRKEYKILDPLTGFISCAGEVLINSGSYGTIPHMGNSRVEPQTTIPQNIHSVRTQKEAIPELQREQEGDAPPDLKWNSQKVSDVVLRSRLGGWTSEMDVRKLHAQSPTVRRLHQIFPHMKICYNNEEERDEMAQKYRYTTSTQAMYGQVNWDSKLPKKLHAPVTTYEAGVPDPLRKATEGEKRPQIWQTVAGSEWDRAQMRTPNFHRQKVSFTAPTKRGNQLPGYGGQINGKNVEYMEDVIEKFEPFTVVRTVQPKEPDPNYKPNIPGYTGHIHHFKTTHVSHYDNNGRPLTTTAAYHRKMPEVDQGHPELRSLNGDLTRIQTKVPPSNPYNQVAQTTDSEINKSIDHLSHPIVVAKKTNNEEYLVKNREKELRSILKKRMTTSMY